MPGSLIRHPERILVNSSAVTGGISASAPVLHGLMEGLGWHDVREEILARDQEAALEVGRLRQILTDYETNPSAPNRAILIFVLEKELAAARTELEYAQAQQRQYALEAAQEAEMNVSHSQSWREWAISGLKSFFGSTAREQTEKYAEMTTIRQKRIEQLQLTLASLNEIDLNEPILPSQISDLEAHDMEALVTEPPVLGEKSIAQENIDSDEDMIEIDTRDGKKMPAEGGYHHDRHLLAYPLTNEFQINADNMDSQWTPVVAALNSGDFVVVWTRHSQDLDDSEIYAQRYSAIGIAQDAEFRVNTYTFLRQSSPSIAALNSGDFVVAWHSDGQDGSGLGVYAQRYSAIGIAQDVEFRVNTYTFSNQGTPSIAALNSGDFVVIWVSRAPNGRESIYAQRYSAVGISQGVEFLLNTSSSPSIAALNSGDFVVAWTSYDGSQSGVYAQRYSAIGIAQDAEFRVNTYTFLDQSSPRIAALNSGDFVVIWVSHPPNERGSLYEIYAQRYSAVGISQGGEFLVDAYAYASTSIFHYGLIPSITGLNSGNFVVAWQRERPHDPGLYTQVYSALGVPQGVKFQINTTPSYDYLRNPSLAKLNSDNFIVVWGSNSYQYKIYGRLISSTNLLPVLEQNQLTLNDAETVVITPSFLSATDANLGAILPNLRFTVNSIQRGVFELITNPGIEITQFSQAQVQAGEIQFVHDGSNISPDLWISVNNGVSDLSDSLPEKASINFNQRPVWINSRLILLEGQRLMLEPLMISVQDDNSPEEIHFTVVNATHGRFELSSNRNQPITAFSAQQITAREIEFVHDGEEIPPTASLSMGDGFFHEEPISLFIAYTPVNDPPYVNRIVGPQIYNLGEAFSFTIEADSFIDPEGEVVLSLSAREAGQSDLPKGFEFNAATQRFLGQIMQTDHWNISLQATDTEGLSAITFFSLRIVELGNPCSISGMSGYRSDGYTCQTMRSFIIAVPSVIGALILAALRICFKNRQIEKSWSDQHYQIHNILRHELKLEIGALDANYEQKYKGLIFNLLGCLLQIQRKIADSDDRYNSRVAQVVAQLSQEEIRLYAAVLILGIRTRIHFPSLYCDEGPGEMKRVMPIYRYFYETLPIPVQSLTTYKFSMEIFMAAFKEILATARAQLTKPEIDVTPILVANKQNGIGAAIAGFFCCRKPILASRVIRSMAVDRVVDIMDEKEQEDSQNNISQNDLALFAAKSKNLPGPDQEPIEMKMLDHSSPRDKALGLPENENHIVTFG